MQSRKILKIFWAACFLPGLLLNSEGGDSASLRNFDKLVPDYTLSHARRLYSSYKSFGCSCDPTVIVFISVLRELMQR